MRKRKNPEELSNQLLCVTMGTKQRILDLRGGGDYHENVIVMLLDFWDEGHKESSNHVDKEPEDKD